MRLARGSPELGAPVLAADHLDLAAALAREGQQLFDRQRIGDPFGEPLGACGLIFEILDRVQAPPPLKPRICWTGMVRQSN